MKYPNLTSRPSPPNKGEFRTHGRIHDKVPLTIPRKATLKKLTKL